MPLVLIASCLLLVSLPATSGEVVSWGAAEWELSVDSGFVDKQESSVFLADSNPELGPTNFTLEDDTEYWVRTRYNSADPEAISEWSESTKFQTAGTGKGWFGVKAAEDNTWMSVTYGNGKFVAVAKDGTKRIMWAEDPTNASNWTAVETPEQNQWYSVTYGDGKFVAVAGTGTNRIMYATDPAGTWTAVEAAEANGWRSVTYGDGKFVAVASSGIHRIMVAEDPTGTWTPAAAMADVGDNAYRSVTYGNGKFVAVADGGTNRIMYATDPSGPWTVVEAPEANNWNSVTYGNGKFVAVAYAGANPIMYATDPSGPWTAVEAPEDNNWYSVTYGDGKFVAVAGDGNGSSNRIMYAEDPTGTWSPVAAPEANNWRYVTYGNGKWVAVSSNGTERVMYSFTGTGDPARALFYDEKNAEAVNDVTLERRYGLDATETDLRKHGIFPLTEQPTYEVAAYVKENEYYRPIRSYQSEVNRANQTISDMQASFEARIAALESEE